MFKEIYKEACDEIKGDKDAILDRAFERASASAAKKKNPVIKFSVIGTAAAAIIIVGAVVVNIDLFLSQTDNYGISDELAQTEMGESAAEGAEEALLTADYADTETAFSAGDNAEDAESELSLSAETGNTEKVAQAEKKNENTAPLEKTEPEKDLVSAADVTDEAGYAETAAGEEPVLGSSSGCGSMARGITAHNEDDSDEPHSDEDKDAALSMYDDDDDDDDDDEYSPYTEKTISYDEYVQYVGFDAAAIKLPDDLPKIEKTPCTVTVDEDKTIVDDTMVFGSFDSERYVTFTVGHLVDAAWAIEDGKKTSSVISVFGEERFGTVYAAVGEVYVIAECGNLTDDEVNDIEKQLDTYGK